MVEVMLDRTKRLTPAIALLASLLVSLPMAQSQANAKEKHTICKTQAASRTYTRVRYATPQYNKRFALYYMASKYGWCGAQYSCLVTMWNHESGWQTTAHNRSGAHGVPQALPGSKMGKGWRNNPHVQIKWGLKYIRVRYGTPCGAWSFWQRNHWY
jgi:hypothetical protein